MGSADDNGQVRCVMRAPCSRCACPDGVIRTKSGQDTVRCASCDSFQYNAPRSETGREVRSLRTRKAISPSQRARVLERDNGTCFLCHTSGVPLDIGHILSVRDGVAQGLTDQQINDDTNLVALCKSCNSGFGARSMPVRLVVSLLLAEQNRRSDTPPAA